MVFQDIQGGYHESSEQKRRRLFAGPPSGGEETHHEAEALHVLLPARQPGDGSPGGGIRVLGLDGVRSLHGRRRIDFPLGALFGLREVWGPPLHAPDGEHGDDWVSC